jgi:hypothetical protein
MPGTPRHVCFSNRPFLVKHFQIIHHCSVDVARGLVLLFGIGTRALPSCRQRGPIRTGNLELEFSVPCGVPGELAIPAAIVIKPVIDSLMNLADDRDHVQPRDAS